MQKTEFSNFFIGSTKTWLHLLQLIIKSSDVCLIVHGII